MMPRSGSFSGAGSVTTDNKRPRSDNTNDDASSDDDYLKSEGISDDLSSDLCGFEDESCDDKMKASKKMKIEWTRELHDKFVEAVETLGPDKAVPSRILEFMGTHSPGLTRQNIASHLQKYRHRSRGRIIDTVGALKSHSSAAPVVQTFLSVHPTSAPAPATAAKPQSGLVMKPAGPGTAGDTPRSSTPPHQQWVHQAVPIWNPWQGAFVYNQLGQPLMPQSVPVPHAFHVPTTNTPPQAPQDLQKAIKEILSQPSAKSPLGLKLDRAGLLQELKSASNGAAVSPPACGGSTAPGVGSAVA